MGTGSGRRHRCTAVPLLRLLALPRRPVRRPAVRPTRAARRLLRRRFGGGGAAAAAAREEEGPVSEEVGVRREDALYGRRARPGRPQRRQREPQPEARVQAAQPPQLRDQAHRGRRVAGQLARGGGHCLSNSDYP